MYVPKVPSDTGEFGFVEYARLLRRRRGTVIASILFACALAAIVAATQRPSFEVTAEIAIQTPVSGGDLEQVLLGGPDLGSQARIMSSPIVVQPVLDAAGLPSGTAAVNRFIASELTVKIIPGTTVISVTVRDSNAKRARDLTRAIVDSFLGQAKADVGKRAADAIALLASSAHATGLELRSVENQLASNPGSTRESLELERDDLQAQLRSNAAQRAQLTSASAVFRTGQVTQPATIPAGPAPRRRLLLLLAAGFVGAGLGVALALIRDRLDNRLHDERDVWSAAGLPVLARLAIDAAEDPDAASRLRAVLLPGRNVDGRVSITLVAVDGQSDAAGLAAGLASSLTRLNRRVAIVDGDLLSPASTTDAPRPGLSDVVANDALRWEEAVRETQTGVVTVDRGRDPSSATGRLAGTRTAELFAFLHGLAQDVLVIARYCGKGADAADLARNTDCALLLVTVGVTSSRELSAAAELLRQSGITVGGCLMQGFGLGKVGQRPIRETI